MSSTGKRPGALAHRIPTSRCVLPALVGTCPSTKRHLCLHSGIFVRKASTFDSFDRSMGTATSVRNSLRTLSYLQPNLIGDENEGWRVARGLLEIEHAWVGRSVTSTRSFGGVDDLISVARRRGVNLDPGVRRKIALMHAEQEVHTLTATRVAAGMAAEQLSHGLGGALKLGTANLGQRRAELGLSGRESGIAGPRTP